MPKLQIDYYGDINCPWCIVGEYRLDKVLAKHFPDLSVEITHHPFLLLPDCPKEGLDIAGLVKSRYGVADPRTAFAAPEAAAKESGLDLNLSKQRFAYSTLPAHTLIRLAQARGTAHQLCVAITSAYFLEARNTGDSDVLAEIASHHGFSFDEAKRKVESVEELEKTRREVAAVVAMGIRSVPQFVIENGPTVKGSPSEEQLVSAIGNAVNVSSQAGCAEGVCSL